MGEETDVRPSLFQTFEGFNRCVYCKQVGYNDKKLIWVPTKLCKKCNKNLSFDDIVTFKRKDMCIVKGCWSEISASRVKEDYVVCHYHHDTNACPREYWTYKNKRCHKGEEVDIVIEARRGRRHHGSGTIHHVVRADDRGDSLYEVHSPELATKVGSNLIVQGVENVVLVYHREIRKRRGIPLIPTPKPVVEAPRARGRSQVLTQMPDFLETERRRSRAVTDRPDFLDELLATGKRRLANQDL